jgi:hypothetical protein
VTLKTGGHSNRSFVKTGGSYCSQSQMWLTFGLGDVGHVDEVEIDWPSGTKQVLRKLPANQFVTVEEDEE